MAVMTDAEFEAFAAEAAAEYGQINDQYGEVAGQVMSAIGSASGSTDPSVVIGNMRAAILAAGAAAGPYGVIVSGVLAAIMTFGEWLVGAYPAVADYNNRDGLLRTAQALGYTSVTDMARAGWVAGNFSAGGMRGRRTPEGVIPETPRDVAAHLLSPLTVRNDSGQTVIPAQAVSIAYGRADSLLAAGALRIVSYQSQVSGRQRYTAICIRIDALPVTMVSTLRLYFPLALTLTDADREGGMPEWWPRKDDGLGWILGCSINWRWLDAPAQEAPGTALFNARKLTEAVAASVRQVIPEAFMAGRTPFYVPPVQPAGGGAGLAIGILAALKFLL